MDIFLHSAFGAVASLTVTIEEQVEIEKGNLPDIDFSSVFKEKYSYLFD